MKNNKGLTIGGKPVREVKTHPNTDGESSLSTSAGSQFEVYACNQFEGHWPVGSAAVVVASSQQHAADVLNSQLRQQGLKGDATANAMALVVRDAPQAVVLCDGNY